MSDGQRLARREVFKIVASAAAAPGLMAGCASAPADLAVADSGRSGAGPAGTPTDPDMVNPVIPWELTLSDTQLGTLGVLCGLIIPADEKSPGADELGAQHFIDEWVSAPYDPMRQDRELVLAGIDWLHDESARRFGSDFGELDQAQYAAICDDICHEPDAQPGFEQAARFFDRIRALTMMAFYTTRQGRADLGYVGNVPLSQWDPPPIEALRHVGLD